MKSLGFDLRITSNRRNPSPFTKKAPDNIVLVFGNFIKVSHQNISYNNFIFLPVPLIMYIKMLKGG